MRKLLFVMLAGCFGNKLKVEPVKVEPIHVTVDVNVRDGRPPPADR